MIALPFVMAGLVPAIHVLLSERAARKTWMPGTRPGMTPRCSASGTCAEPTLVRRRERRRQRLRILDHRKRIVRVLDHLAPVFGRKSLMRFHAEGARTDRRIPGQADQRLRDRVRLGAVRLGDAGDEPVDRLVADDRPARRILRVAELLEVRDEGLVR